MPSLNGINFELKAFSQTDTLSYSKDALMATRIFQINWEDRDAFLLALVGQSSTAGNVISRTLGQEFGGTEFPLICNRATARGNGKLTITSSGEAIFDKAIVTAEYAAIKPDEEEVFEDPITGELSRPITTTIDFTTEILAVPGGKFTAAGKTIKESFAVLIPKTNINVTFRNVPFSIFTAGTPDDNVSVMAKINDKGGKINSDNPTWIAGRIFTGIETLMFNGATATRETPVFKGELLESPWTVNYSFTHKRQGWNTIYDPDVGSRFSDVTPPPFLNTTFKDIQIKYT